MKKHSKKTYLITIVFSVFLGFLFASSFDFTKPTQAIDQPLSPQTPLGSLPTLKGLVRQVTPAVVNISTTKAVQPGRRFRNDPFMDEYFKKFFGAPESQNQNSLGSGFIIDKEGTILTNNHVVQGADEILVKLSDGRKFQAKILGTDPKLDIAVIRIQGGNGSFPYVPLGDSSSLEVGENPVEFGDLKVDRLPESVL